MGTHLGGSSDCNIIYPGEGWRLALIDLQRTWVESSWCANATVDPEAKVHGDLTASPGSLASE